MGDVPPLMTRRQLAEFLQGKGFPVTLPALNQACAPNRAQDPTKEKGPEPEAYWGKDPALQA